MSEIIKDAEWVMEQMAETIVSHPGNMRCLRLEARIDEAHDPVWTVYAIDRRGRKFAHVGQGDEPEKAMNNFWNNRLPK
jgi:hypothetical protein